ncbi:ABC transporter permease [Streptosporangium roseum]|uniref:Binding-protein dependent transport system inner membrane protein n=1 Tax=Streptosporangium roseum (strain ATCC 12428 / DSM 43021 / JCM 3005 / KCTC 9067 / NCIMB 10171 / NRRL 2505 / NI 9100) TaxID=479432 RepID=D2ATZ2_STRRD|nr:ABC transporter permease [Streptosporangium roseum]ACZ88647.1 binding-protein dependent transport system inner membrane protein [Streptosporangium roseum DSM 43021]
MVTYIIRRLIGAVIMLLVVSMATFAIFFLVPQLAGATPEGMASRYVGRTATAETAKLAAERLGFNDPLVVQYGRFVKGIVAGAEYDYGPGVEACPAPCLGYSFITRQPVFPDLMNRLPVTLSLAIGAAVIWVVMGVGIGVLSALRRGSVFDRAAMTVALAGVSLPIFFTGLVSLLVFSYGNPFSFAAQGGHYTTFLDSPGQWAYNLLLPWITLAFLFAATYARLTRAGMLETMNEDYIRTARAKGLRESTVVTKHGLRAALTPILTVFGLDFGLLIGGAVLTESAYSLPGLGKYAIDAIVNQDLPKVMGVTLLAALFVVVASLIVDLLYAVVDPRVRLA